MPSRNVDPRMAAKRLVRAVPSRNLDPRMAAKRLVRRTIRRALLAYARAEPSDGARAPGDGAVVILLVSAWGMGGTIRAAHNLAGYMATHRDVEIISVFRRRQEPFFGSFPPGVRVTALDDERPDAPRPPLQRLVRSLLKRWTSVLMHPYDRAAPHFDLWVDVQLARRLRRRAGYLIGTRPGLNMVVSDLALPGFIAIGEEQMHLLHHDKTLRASMPKRYAGLDALAVLTQLDMERYRALLDDGVRLVRIPNTVHAMGGAPSDPGAKVVLAAGRLTAQKGFDMLIDAYAQVAPDHPDWRLRICGRGDLDERLQAQIDARGLHDVVELAGPSANLGEDMANASIFVLSSRFEGFPLVLLEAMSKSLAIVAFDCPTGPADIIDDHRNGILVPARDVDGLAAGIREMIEDEALRRRSGPAAADTARQYTMDAVGPRWDELFEALRAERARAAS